MFDRLRKAIGLNKFLKNLIILAQKVLLLRGHALHIGVDRVLQQNIQLDHHLEIKLIDLEGFLVRTKAKIVRTFRRGG